MSEQLELLNGDEFNDPRVLAQQEFSALAGDSGDAHWDYPTPMSGADKWQPNPIYTQNAQRHYDTAPTRYFGKPEETFLPSYEIESPQDVISPESVSHMAQNATGLDVPNISAYQFGDTTMVMNGNHRVNAALERGQMLVPATLRKAER